MLPERHPKVPEYSALFGGEGIPGVPPLTFPAAPHTTDYIINESDPAKINSQAANPGISKPASEIFKDKLFRDRYDNHPTGVGSLHIFHYLFTGDSSVTNEAW